MTFNLFREIERVTAMYPRSNVIPLPTRCPHCQKVYTGTICPTCKRKPTEE